VKCAAPTVGFSREFGQNNLQCPLFLSFVVILNAPALSFSRPSFGLALTEVADAADEVVQARDEQK
jgi:hypothetical protein